MPFKSEKQRRFLYAKHPEIAKRWSEEEGDVAHPPPEKRVRKEAIGRRMKRVNKHTKASTS